MKDHMGYFSKTGYVVRTGEALKPVYDLRHLPDTGYEAGSVFQLRLNSLFYKRERSGWYSLSLPASEEKLEKAAEVLSVSDIEDSRLLLFTSEYSGMEEVLPLTYGIRELNAFAACLVKENLLSSEEQREKLFAALEAERSETMQEAMEVVERLEEYELLPENIETAEDYGKYLLEKAQITLDEELKPFVDVEGYGASQMKKQGIVLTEQGMVFRKEQLIRQMPEELVELKLFSPLVGMLYGKDEYGYQSDRSEDMMAAELCPYIKEIEKQIIKEQLDSEGDRGLAVYLGNRILKQKVFSMTPDVELWKGELWGVLKVASYGELSEAELDMVKEEWSGQASDGWGEGFEQRPIKTEDGELYVSFWNSGRDYFITTEDELKNGLFPQPGIRMGGM